MRFLSICILPLSKTYNLGRSFFTFTTARSSLLYNYFNTLNILYFTIINDKVQNRDLLVFLNVYGKFADFLDVAPLITSFFCLSISFLHVYRTHAQKRTDFLCMFIISLFHFVLYNQYRK